MLPDDPLTWPLLEALRDCLCAELSDDPPGECCIMPGAHVALPNCCSLAWVRLVRVYPTANFPNPAPGPNTMCPGISGWAAVIELGVGRCVPVVDEYGNEPPCDDMEAAARRQMSDMHAIRRAAHCCDWRDAAGMPVTTRYLIGVAEPFGPDGGCGGSTLQLTVELCGSVCGG